MTNLEAKVQLKFLYNIEVDRGEYHIAKTIETAIDALENIDRIKAERDALMEDLKKVPLCHCCKYDLSGNDEVCSACLLNAGSGWEWKGVQNG